MIAQRAGGSKLLFLIAIAVCIGVSVHFGWPVWLVVMGIFWSRRGWRTACASSRVDMQPAVAQAPIASNGVASRAAALTMQLREHAAYAARNVPGSAYALVYRISQTIESVLPAMDREGATASADAFTITETVERYLPDTIAAFLRIPSPGRLTQKLADGRTAQEHLIEQLTILDERVRASAAHISQTDASALLHNGAFLRERFPTPYFKTS